MGTRPDEIRSEIEQTREELASDVDRLADRTVPSRVVERRWEGVKDRARGVADKMMGTRDSAQDMAAQAGGRVQETAGNVATTVRQAPEAMARQTRGNPMAVGLIAFGAGLLAASLLPETEVEKRAGVAIAERSGDLVDKVKETGREFADDLSGSVREGAEQVKETAQQAAANTADQARQAGRTTVEQTRQAAS